MLFVLLLTITAVTYAQCMVGGNDAPRNTTRHHVRIDTYSSWTGRWHFYCSGSIVGNYTILTAYGCVSDSAWMSLDHYRIIVDQYDRQSPGDIYNVEEIKLHSMTPQKVHHQDVALIKTDRQLPTENIIPFPDQNEDFTGQTCSMTGWGSTGPYWPIVYPTILQFGEGKIMSVKECRTIWTAGNKPDAYVTKKNICFGGGQDGTVSSCRYDGGNPLVCDGKLAGVVSWGDRFCRPAYPTVCMAVSKHLGWILDHHFG